MLNKKETQKILEEFFIDCLKYWRSVLNDERTAFKRAISDVECITRNPFSPQGELLNEEAKIEFVKYRNMDL